MKDLSARGRETARVCCYQFCLPSATPTDPSYSNFVRHIVNMFHSCFYTLSHELLDTFEASHRHQGNDHEREYAPPR